MEEELMPTEAGDAVARDMQPDQAREEVDLATVKSMLELPATASDIELITVLVNLVANLQEKYEGVLQDAVAMEDAMTNRDLSDFSDVIAEDAVPFWKDQLLQNRYGAMEALVNLRNRVYELTAQQPQNEYTEETRVIPLRNRLAAIERTVETVAAEAPAVEETTAVKIRNRAHEIVRSDKVPFIIAFARAEKELLTH